MGRPFLFGVKHFFFRERKRALGDETPSFFSKKKEGVLVCVFLVFIRLDLYYLVFILNM
jgi:hypothetical protein